MSIAAGDVVVLKSGGLPMTVEWVDSPIAYCTWFEKTKKFSDRFQLVALEKN